MRLNLLISDMAYAGKQRACLFEGPTQSSASTSRGIVGRDAATCRMAIDDQFVSRQHFEILYADEKFWVRNLSRFGTKIVGKQDLMEIDAQIIIENSDRIQIGETEIVASLMHTQAKADTKLAKSPGQKSAPNQSSTADGPFDDVLGLAEQPKSIKPPPKTTELSNSGLHGPPKPAPTDIKLAPARPAKVNKHQIPDDLDLERLLGIEPAKPASQSIAPPTEARKKPPQERGASPSNPPRAAIDDGTGSMVEILLAAGCDPQQAEELASKTSPKLVGELLGAAIGTLTGQLIVRDSFKRNFRLATTEVKATGNNPLKLPSGAGDVLYELLEPPQGFLGGVDAVRDAALELQIHQAAVAECIRTTFMSLMDFLDPANVESETDKSGRTLLGNFAGGRDAASWKAFRELFERNFGDRHRAFLTIYLERFGQDYEANTTRAKSGPSRKNAERKR